jgi:hypothetical protein
LGSLIQWFDKIINETILKDMDKAIGNVRKEIGRKYCNVYFYKMIKRQRQAREVRMEMMRKEAKEKLGIEMEEIIGKEEKDEEEEWEKELAKLERGEEEKEDDETKREEEEKKKEEEEMEEEKKRDMPNPMDQRLPPIPSREAIFGVFQKGSARDSCLL